MLTMTGLSWIWFSHWSMSFTLRKRWFFRQSCSLILIRYLISMWIHSSIHIANIPRVHCSVCWAHSGEENGREPVGLTEVRCSWLQGHGSEPGDPDRVCHPHHPKGGGLARCLFSFRYYVKMQEWGIVRIPSLPHLTFLQLWMQMFGVLCIQCLCVEKYNSIQNLICITSIYNGKFMSRESNVVC